MKKNNISEKTASLLLKIKAVTLNPKKPYQFTTGILSPVYIDCRLLMSYPRERRTIRNFLIEAIMKIGDHFDVVAGTATAGIPHAAWIAEKMNLPMVYVRGQAKEHGKQNQIEGIIKKGQRVAVIEDLISTGKSSSATVLAVRDAGSLAPYIFAITTYQMKKSKDTFKNNRIKLVTLTDFPTIVKVASKEGYIKPEEQQTVLEWTKDPSSWGKRMGFE